MTWRAAGLFLRIDQRAEAVFVQTSWGEEGGGEGGRGRAGRGYDRRTLASR